MLVAGTPETTNPVSRPVRAQRGALHLDAWRRGSPGSSAARATRPRASTGPITSSGGSRTSSPSSPTCGAASTTNKKVGGLFPNDGDGNAWGDKKLGFPPVAGEAGLHADRPRPLPEPHAATSPRRSPPSRRPACEIVTGVVIPPDFKTFLTQARSRASSPRSSRVGKALLFPGAIEALGDARQRSHHRGLVEPVASVQVARSPGRAPGSSPTPTTAATKKQWTQPIGFAHALFEVAVDALKRGKPTDKRGRASTRSRRPISTPSSAGRMGRRGRSRTWPRRRWSAASGAQAARPLQVRSRHHDQQRRQRDPDRRQDGADGLTGADVRHGRWPTRMPRPALRGRLEAVRRAGGHRRHLARAAARARRWASSARTAPARRRCST